MTECDPSVSAAVHYAASQYYKVQQDYAEFFKSAMMYLVRARAGPFCDLARPDEKGMERHAIACILGVHRQRPKLTFCLHVSYDFH